MNSLVDLVPLGELGEIVSGSTPNTHVQEFWGGDIPWITPADLTNHEGIYFRGNLRKITEAGYKNCSTRLLPPGSILYSSRAPIGHCAVTTYPLCTNQGFKNIIPNSRLDPVYGFFSLKFYTPQIEALGRGATFTEVTKEIIENFQIPLPPLPEQRRIAALLAKADRLRRLRRYALELGEGYLQAVFVEMFGDPATNPKGWQKDTLSNLNTHFFYGTSEKCFETPKGLPVLRIPNVLNGHIDLTDLKYAILKESETTKLLLRNGDLLFVRTNGNPDYVGRCTIFDLRERFLFASYLICGRIDKKRLNPLFTVSYLQSVEGRKAMQPFIRTTAGQSNIGIEGLGQIPIFTPPLYLQEKFANAVRKYQCLTKRQRESLRQAEHLFETLLQRAFRGEG